MSKVQYQSNDGVAVITMDDGKANVMTVDMQQQIHKALDQAQADNSIVVIAGRDGVFSGGFDLKVFQSGDVVAARDMVSGGMKLAERVYQFPFPVVTAITGHAIAMGAFLTLASDYRVGCSQGAKTAANEVMIGLTVPHFAIELCRQKLTPAAFSRAVTLGMDFSGQDAVNAGFWDEAVDAQTVLERAIEHAHQFTKIDMPSHRGTKKRSRAIGWQVLNDALLNDEKEWQSRISNVS